MSGWGKRFFHIAFRNHDATIIRLWCFLNVCCICFFLFYSKHHALTFISNSSSFFSLSQSKKKTFPRNSQVLIWIMEAASMKNSLYCWVLYRFSFFQLCNFIHCCSWPLGHISENYPSSWFDPSLVASGFFPHFILMDFTVHLRRFKALLML